LDVSPRATLPLVDCRRYVFELVCDGGVVETVPQYKYPTKKNPFPVLLVMRDSEEEEEEEFIRIQQIL